MIEQQDQEGEAVSPASRPRSSRRWRAIAVAGVVAVAGTLAVAALHRPAAHDSHYALVEQQAAPAVATVDPLRAELVRCRTLPPGAEHAACRAAWDESRHRFFGEPGAPAQRALAPSRER